MRNGGLSDISSLTKECASTQRLPCPPRLHGDPGQHTRPDASEQNRTDVEHQGLGELAKHEQDGESIWGAR
jgi:hypothetical protein